MRSRILSYATVVTVYVVAASDAMALAIAQTFSFERTPSWNVMKSKMAAAEAMGLDAIWIPPAYKSSEGVGSLGYDPYDRYDLGDYFQQGTRATLWGTKDELVGLIEAAHALGIQVYADVVLNHNGARMNYVYPDFSYTDFHHNGPILDWSDPWWVENGDLVGLEDLKQEKRYVRDHLLDWLAWFQDELQLDGFRYDAVKHVPKWFWSEVAEVAEGYVFGEVVSGDPFSVGDYASTGMDLLDYPLYYVLLECFGRDARRPLADLAKNGLEAEVTTLFIENHDMPGPAKKNLAYAHILTRGGNVVLFIEDLLNPWLREKLTTQIWVHHNLAWGATDYKITANHQLVYERRGNLLVGINRAYVESALTVTTAWRSVWLKDYSGHRPDEVWVDDSGRVSFTIPADNYVFYAPR